MRMSLLAAAPVVALLVLGTAACDKNGTASPAAPAGAKPASTSTTVSLCAVLTEDRAKQLLGQDATPDKQDAEQCSYQVVASGASVTVQSQVDGSGQLYDINHNLGNADLKQAVSDVGDKAFFRADLETLYTRKNGVDLSVQLVTPGTLKDPTTALNPTRQLALDIVAKF
ncbi:MAG TPA: hypothetical protein VGM75_18040 [Pseudonocardiaceae bacterium]